MQLICKKCGGLEFTENKHDSIHKTCVNCAYCNSFIKFGTLEGKKIIPEGGYIATVLSAEEKDKKDGGKYIVVILEINNLGKITHFIWKSEITNQYNKYQIKNMLAGFGCNISDFKSVNSLLSYIVAKEVFIQVEHYMSEGKPKVRINNWKVADSCE